MRRHILALSALMPAGAGLVSVAVVVGALATGCAHKAAGSTPSASGTTTGAAATTLPLPPGSETVASGPWREDRVGTSLPADPGARTVAVTWVCRDVTGVTVETRIDGAAPTSTAYTCGESRTVTLQVPAGQGASVSMTGKPGAHGAYAIGFGPARG